MHVLKFYNIFYLKNKTDQVLICVSVKLSCSESFIRLTTLKYLFS